MESLSNDVRAFFFTLSFNLEKTQSESEGKTGNLTFVEHPRARQTLCCVFHQLCEAVLLLCSEGEELLK